MSTSLPSQSSAASSSSSSGHESSGSTAVVVINSKVEPTSPSCVWPPLTLFHVPRFRSTRPLWLYLELEQLYPHSASPSLPPLSLYLFNDIAKFRVDKPEWYLRLNPNGKVPTLLHNNDIAMFEGGAICSYLLHLFDSQHRLLPSLPAIQARYYEMVSWCASTLDNLAATSSPIQRVMPIAAPAAATPASSALPATVILPSGVASQLNDVEQMKRNEQYFREVAAPHLTKLLTQANTKSSSSSPSFLCGSEFTATDVIVGFLGVGWIDKMKWLVCDGINDDPHFPLLSRYFNRVRARSAYQLAVSIGRP